MLYRCGRFVLDPGNLRLTVDDESRALEPKSFRLLQFLIENRERVVSKEEILKAVWEGVAVSDNALTRAIAQIRKALDDDPKQPRYIETVPTVGYRFLGSVEADAVATPAAAARSARHSRILVVGLVLAVLAAAGIVAARFLSSKAPESAALSPVPFTTYPGSEILPTFSPDGTQIAFTWDGPHQENQDIYVKAIGSETPLRLTTDPASDMAPQWSPDGRRIAFARLLPGGKTAVMLIAPLGGPERKLTEYLSHWNEAGAPSVSYGISWSPDGKWLAVSGDADARGLDRILLVSVETGEVRPLNLSPPREMGDYTPKFSPDGHALIFTRQAIFTPGSLYRIELDRDLMARGEPQKLPEPGLQVRTPVWANGGREILFASGGVYRMPASGAAPPVRIESLGRGQGTLALSKDGRHLAYSLGTFNSNIWRVDLTAQDRGPERLIASSKREVFPQYSPNGRKIVFYSSRSGTDQIWVCDADGSNAAAITSMKPGITGSPRWSPDGRTIVFDSNVTGFYQVYTVGADGGKVRQMTTGAASHYSAAWSRDGRWLYYASNAEGEAQLWKVPSQGGEAVRVTRNGGMAAQESPDGRTLYYVKEEGKGSLWTMPVEGGPEKELAESIYRYNYAVTEDGVYLVSGPSIDFLNPATGRRKTLVKIAQPPDLGLSVSPDGHYLAFSEIDSMGSDLMLVENFH